MALQEILEGEDIVVEDVKIDASHLLQDENDVNALKTRLENVENENLIMKNALANCLRQVEELAGQVEKLKKNGKSNGSTLKKPKKPLKKPGTKKPIKRPVKTPESTPVKKPRKIGKPRMQKPALGTAKKSTPGTPAKKSGPKKPIRSPAVKANKSIKSKGKVAAAKARHVKKSGSVQVGKNKVFFNAPVGFEEKKDDGELPKTTAKLDFIYGYNGKSCRDNLFYTNGREGLLYNIAGTGVHYNIEANTQKHFLGQNEDITGLAKHPFEPLCATGQSDPKGAETPYVCVWNYETMEEIAHIKDAGDREITCLDFSPDGTKLVVIGNDDNHTIAVYDWKKKKQLLSASGGKEKVLAVSFDPYDTTDEDGKVKDNKELHFITCAKKNAKLWTMGKVDGKLQLKGKNISTYSIKKEVQKAFLGVEFLSKGVQILASTGGCFVCKDYKPTKPLDVDGSGIGTIVKIDENSFITGGSGGKVIVWKDFERVQTVDVGELVGSPVKIRSMDHHGVSAEANEEKKDGHVVLGLSNNAMVELDMTTQTITILASGHTKQVVALAVHPQKPIFATGGRDKILQLTNYETDKPAGIVEGKSKIIMDVGIQSLDFSPNGQYLAVGHQTGKIAMLKTEDLTEIWNVTKRKGEISSMEFSPDGLLLAVGTSDSFLDIFKVTNGHLYHSFKDHNAGVSHLAWSKDSTTLMTNTRDYEQLFFNVKEKERLAGVNENEIEWNKLNVILSWGISGVFKGGYDGTDINSATVSKKHNVVIAGDDFNQILLLKYPAYKNGAKRRSYFGHSSHVYRVRLTPDEDHFISVGSADCSFVKWKLE